MSCLEEIVPQIRNTQDPEGTIVKFAADNNLTPAQVEKVCQSVNILKTLNFMEKSANRGGTFSIVNPENVLSGYMKPKEIIRDAPLEKAASAEVDPEDVNSWIDAPATEAYDRIPNLFEEAYGVSDDYSVKLASQIDSLHKEANEFWKKHFDNRDDAQTIGQIKDDYESKARDIFEKLADHIRSHPDITFANVEEDAMRLFDGSVKEACDMASSYLEQCHVVHERVPEKVLEIKKLANDRTGLASLMQEAQDAIDMVSNTVAFAKTAKAAEADEPEILDQYGRPASKKKPKKSKGDAAKEKRVKDTAQFLGLSEKKVESMSPEQIINKLSPHAGDPASSAYLPSQTHSEEDRKTFTSKSDVESFIQNATKNPLKNIGSSKNLLLEAIGADDTSAKKFKQKAKSTKDKALQDARLEAGLQKLMISDPIISEADPDLIKEIYQTLVEHAPDLAQDIGMLRFALREAIQYEGVPPQTLKDLIDMQKMKSETRSRDIKAKADELSIM
jgi:hypothetical protein